MVNSVDSVLALPDWTVLTGDVAGIIIRYCDKPAVASVRLSCCAWKLFVDNSLRSLDVNFWPDLPSSIEKFQAVEKVELKGHYISDDNARALLFPSLMHSLAELPRLSSLSLRYAGMGCLEGIDALVGLTSITVSRTHDGRAQELVALPSSLSRLSKLREVKLCNIVPEYSVLVALPSLERVELQGQTLKSRSSLWVCCNPLQGVDCLTQLKVLCAKCNYGVSRLPNDIGSLTDLRELDLSKNMLWSLPAQVGQLSQLTKLDVSSNCLCSLPEEIGRLTNLQYLDLSTNSRLQLPSALSNLQNLQQLSLNWIWSDLQVLVDCGAHLHRLHTLSLVGNGISHLPADVRRFTSLASLALAMNNLEALPEELGCLTALTSLDVSDNRLACLPPSIGKLSALTWLGCRSNALSRLPEELGRLSRLQSLDVSMNALAVLPNSLSCLGALQTLSLSLNPLRSLPPGIADLQALRTLEMYYVQVADRSLIDWLSVVLPRTFVFTNSSRAAAAAAAALSGCGASGGLAAA